MLITLARAEKTPVTLAEAKQHLRVDHTDDDALVDRALKAAVDYVEKHTNLALQPQMLQLRAEEWPCDPILLPRAPVRDVTSVKYIDEDGVEQTVADDLYTWEQTPDGAEVYFTSAFTEPALHERRHGVVRITFTAGFDDPDASGSGDDPNLALPDAVTMAVLIGTELNFEGGSLTRDQAEQLHRAREAYLTQLRIYL